MMGITQTHKPGIARALVACGIRLGTSAPAKPASMWQGCGYDFRRYESDNCLPTNGSEATVH
jgi:hypothetical protein